MSKIIQFDESLFKFSGKQSRKLKSNPSNKIKIKESKPKPQSLKRNHILKFIREQQEKNYKKVMEGDPYVKNQDILQDSFKSNFSDTLNYLMDIAEKEKDSKPSHNHTVRKQSVHENVSLEIPNTFRPPETTISNPQTTSNIQLSSPVKDHSPSWGCLKNGSLPTFRDWKNRTQKIPLGSTTSELPSTSISPILAEINEKRSQKPDNNVARLMYPKQKRTVRRTYKVGRHKQKPQVSVLVSNRTLRNKVSTESQHLKQVPIQDVRSYLVKKGFIKVGSSSPIDVLRKMYETARLMCGEMENHNPDNLLYNYFHNHEDT
tara:strand:+ start:10890 stop:11843 length:954 start_codon:yes stop_codon:yes gene_type:complete